MQPQKHVAYPGFQPRTDNLHKLAELWQRRESGFLTTDWGETQLVYGEPVGSEGYSNVEKSLFTSIRLDFRVEHPGRAAAPPVLASLLWEAASRVAQPKALHPKQTFTLRERLRKDLPLAQATWEFLGKRTELSLKPLIRVDKWQRKAVVSDLATLVALGLAVSEEKAAEAAGPERSRLDRAIALIDAGEFTEAIALLVEVRSPDSRAWTGYAIYHDPSRPEAHRRTSGRMLMKAAMREGSAAAKSLLDSL